MHSNIEQEKISVIIPTFNRATFLPSAVKSVIDQKYKNIEIIIVDDGSDDDTQDVVNTLKKRCPNIIYCNNVRLKGPSGARNSGIIKASGHYISFLDSDDTWIGDHLEKGVSILCKYPEIDVVFGNYSIVDFDTKAHRYNFFDQKKILNSLKSTQIEPGVKILNGNLFKALLQENFFSIASGIFRKSLIIKNLIDESVSLSEDRDFAIKLYKEANATFALREKPLFIAYKHNANIDKPATNVLSDLGYFRRVLESHLYLFTKYLSTYDLSNEEKNLLNKLVAEKLSNLSYLYGKDREYMSALFSMLKSFKYSFTLNQVKNIIKVLSTILLIIKIDVSGIKTIKKNNYTV